MKVQIEKGTRFTTPHEQGTEPCVALESPDQYGNFMAIDSEGIECSFCVAMVSEVYS